MHDLGTPGTSLFETASEPLWYLGYDDSGSPCRGEEYRRWGPRNRPVVPTGRWWGRHLATRAAHDANASGSVARRGGVRGLRRTGYRHPGACRRGLRRRVDRSPTAGSERCLAGSLSRPVSLDELPVVDVGRFPTATILSFAHLPGRPDDGVEVVARGRWRLVEGPSTVRPRTAAVIAKASPRCRMSSATRRSSVPR
jgi:hypothetical protein